MFNFLKKTIIIFWHQKGFSILETIIVIGIIAIGLVGVVSLVVQNIQVQYINRDILIASQLAQEGLELARNIRDKNWLDIANLPWTFQDIAEQNSIKIFIILSDQSTVDVIGIDDAQAKLLNNNGYYNYQSGSETIFRRIIKTDNNYSASSTVVSCIVQWTEKGQTQQYIADTILSDWR